MIRFLSQPVGAFTSRHIVARSRSTRMQPSDRFAQFYVELIKTYSAADSQTATAVLVQHQDLFWPLKMNMLHRVAHVSRQLTAKEACAEMVIIIDILRRRLIDPVSCFTSVHFICGYLANPYRRVRTRMGRFVSSYGSQSTLWPL